MKLSKLFMIALLAGTLALIGCGDDTTTSDNGGNGGGVAPNVECNVGICAADTDVGRTAKAACVNEINDCLALGQSTEAQCIAFGVETCNA